MKITQPDGTTYELGRDESRELLTNFSVHLFNDTPKALELRTMIANAFAKRYLKSIAHNATMEAMSSGLANMSRTMVQEELRDFVSRDPGLSSKTELASQYRETIKNFVSGEFKRLYQEQWNELAKKHNNDIIGGLEKAYNKERDAKAAQLIEAEVERRVNIIFSALRKAVPRWDVDIESLFAEEGNA